MMFLQYFLLLLSEGTIEPAPSPGAEVLWTNNLGNQIHWQNNSFQEIEWTQG